MAGGAGSSHESLYTGTPMLMLPFGGDQLGNAEKLKLAGTALTLNKLNLNVNDIVSKIDLLLKDENVKKNSKRLEILAKINSKRKFNNGAVDTENRFIKGNNYGFIKYYVWIRRNFVA